MLKQTLVLFFYVLLTVNLEIIV